MKFLLCIATILSTAYPVLAETRTYGPLILDFARAQKMGQSIVVPSKNSQGQPLFIAVLCAERLFNFTGSQSKWNDWGEPANIHEARIIADVCNFI